MSAVVIWGVDVLVAETKRDFYDKDCATEVMVK
jgi:hypothetical protein